MEHEKLKVSGISFDSRKIRQGMLFALIKENNQYISDALNWVIFQLAITSTITGIMYYKKTFIILVIVLGISFSLC